MATIIIFQTYTAQVRLTFIYRHYPATESRQWCSTGIVPRSASNVAELQCEAAKSVQENTTTITDELRFATNKRSKVVGIVKDRG
jgi:hypothetical protein